MNAVSHIAPESDSSPTELFEQNMKALRTHHPEIADRLLTAENKSQHTYTLEVGKRGMPTIKCADTQGDFYLCSPYDPVSEAKRLVDEAIEGKDFNVFVNIGLTLGYVVEAALKDQKTSISIVVVEPEFSAFEIAMRSRDLTGLLGNKQIIWSIGDEIDTTVATVMSKLSLLTLRGWVPLISQPIYRIHKDFIELLFKKLSVEVTGQKLSKATTLIASELFLKNSFENLPYALGAPGVMHFLNKWKDKPAVIISAGPSLEKQLDLLREHQNNILMIAVGPAWKSLRAANIEPQIVVTVDPFEPNYTHFEGLDAKREWLVTDFACNTDIVRTFKGPMIFGHSTPEKETLFRAIYGEWGILLTGGSVANSAMSFALTLDASPIILVGQDLGYTGGISHATGHTGKHSLADAIAEKPEDFHEVPGYGGGPSVLTNSPMLTYRVWFERIITQLAKNRVINATEGGAKIEGALEMPLREVLSLHAAEIIDTKDLWPANHKNKNSDRNKIIKNLKVLGEKIKKIQSLSVEARKIMESIVAASEKNEDCRDFEIQYNKLVRRIGTQNRIADFFLSAFVQNEMFLTERRNNLLGENRADRYSTNLMLHTNLPKACDSALH
ncbi:MAG: motility associated factor glycosyltransferase family protein, partial [Betaproteobacteria bacterium]|nr:motility associated factor glycosyltransferase family protein [Betaproteobacteria bacterium]